jgi:hyperosmotically inducible protein
MIRGFFRLILVVLVVVALGAFFIGYRWADGDGPDVDRPVGTTGPAPDIDVDTERAREAGAEVGERVAVGAEAAQRAVADASLTSKIKAKMALDDRVRAANIDVDTAGSVVTLSGRVASQDERTRALQLAKDTDGVTSVVDRLTVAAR